ncbi:MAG TPA: serine hydrolase domain-containing protein [Pirellulales bacterium]|jgi:CubicO group peptidase (beta-lactamase class C family)
MSSTGLSKPRLARLREVLSGHVERKEMPGLVALVSHHDEVHIETIGEMTVGQPAPMSRDTIFRIASLSKPVTAAAAMILVEECKLRLDDSIEPWLPELANRRVLKSLSSPPDDPNETVPAHRAITVRDLLTFRMGFGSLIAPPNTYPIQRLVREYKIGGDGAPRPARGPSTEEWLKRLSSLPWMTQPGERWMYHVASDVLSVLIARVSGQSLGEFMRQHLFEPLGMRDTGFYVPDEKLDRLPACYNRGAGKLNVFDDVANSSWRGPPPFESGGGGLVSTVSDYFAFCRMLLNKGRHDGEQILSRAAVELMTTDHLTPEQRTGAEVFFGGYRSWGFGMSVDIRRDELYHVPGRFGWDGGLGTSAYTDPENEMIGILFTQRMMESPEQPRVFTDFWTLAYGALV